MNDHETTAQHPASTAQLHEGIYPGRRVTALLDDGRLRRVEMTGHADTFFSVPARASIDGRRVRGFLHCATVAGFDTATDDDPAVVKFSPYRND